MNALITLTAAQVSIEVDPQFGYETGIVTYEGQQPAVIDTIFTDFDEATNEAFENKVYDEGMMVSEAAADFGCRFVFTRHTDEMNEVRYYFRKFKI